MSTKMYIKLSNMRKMVCLSMFIVTINKILGLRVFKELLTRLKSSSRTGVVQSSQILNKILRNRSRKNKNYLQLCQKNQL